VTSREARERQRAFTGLLMHPVIDRFSHPELWSLVRHPRHRSVLLDWYASRLGYRLVVTESAARLFRLPLIDTVLAPHRFEPPSRRVLVLALLAAVAAEDAEDVTTTQDLSDRVRALSHHEEVQLATYDPDRFAERSVFVKAVDVLVGAGALRPMARGSEEQREGWAHRRDAVGGAYEIRRDLLLRMVDPASLRAAVDRGHVEDRVPEGAARYGLMRRLLELPVCYYDDLTEAERVYLSSQRHRILAWCTEMTGWIVEQRTEGMALIAADEADTDVPFPRLRAVDFATVTVLDELVRTQATDRTFSEDAVVTAAAEVRARYPKAMTKELATNSAVANKALGVLRALDLVRPGDRAGSWRLTAAAARFRNPKVVSVTTRLDIGMEP
jgi:uncharacterized protein (TIGR02678 family)